MQVVATYEKTKTPGYDKNLIYYFENMIDNPTTAVKIKSQGSPKKTCTIQLGREFDIVEQGRAYMLFRDNFSITIKFQADE